MFDIEKQQREINENVHDEIIQGLMDDCRKYRSDMTVERIEYFSKRLMDDLENSTLTTYPR